MSPPQRTRKEGIIRIGVPLPRCELVSEVRVYPEGISLDPALRPETQCRRKIFGIEGHPEGYP